MGYKGDSLGTWVTVTKKPTHDVAVDITDDVGERMTGLARRNAPVDSGDLRESLDKIPVHRVRIGGFPGFASGVHTFLDYAPSVEHGSGLWGPRHAKYLIKPRDPNGVLSWLDKATGERRFAKYIWHPGQPPQKYVARAVAQCEAEFPAIGRKRLASYKRIVEAEWRAL